MVRSLSVLLWVDPACAGHRPGGLAVRRGGRVREEEHLEKPDTYRPCHCIYDCRLCSLDPDHVLFEHYPILLDWSKMLVETSLSAYRGFAAIQS